MDEVSHRRQTDIEVVLVGIRHIGQGRGHVAGLLTNLNQVDHQLRKQSALSQGLRQGLAVGNGLAGAGDGLLDHYVGHDLLGDTQRLQHRHTILKQGRERARELPKQVESNHLSNDGKLHYQTVQ